MDTHCEKNLIINNRELKYSGIFRANELMAAINRALESKGYKKREKKSEERVTPEGRKSYVELRPYKEKTSYVTLMIKIKIIVDNLTEDVEEVNGVKQKFQNGNLIIIFDAWSLTDYENRWGMKPWAFFLKGFINKFIYTFPQESGYFGELTGDTAYIYAHIKKLLDSYKHEAGVIVKEEDIRKSVEEDIKKEVEEMNEEGK